VREACGVAGAIREPQRGQTGGLILGSPAAVVSLPHCVQRATITGNSGKSAAVRAIKRRPEGQKQTDAGRETQKPPVGRFIP
jgi:hypothetical protein